VASAAGADAVVWSPEVAFARLVLSVSAPGGQVIERSYAPGETVAFSLFDRAGQLRPDGDYIWELRLVPVLDPATKTALAAARRTGDDTIAEALRAAGKLPRVSVQSGSFAVAGGELVTPGLTEGTEGASAPISDDELVSVVDASLTPVFDATTVIGGDLTVHNSLCVGFDCTSSETFGFDTIRLKENSTRIKFEDTSAAGFPSSDWQLTANDSASGGANKFSIEDISGARVPFTVLANAPTDSVFVASSGRVGFRTATPVLDLHVKTGNTPGLRLEQDGSSGFLPQAWDVAGNETSFFIRDVTGGSRLPFRIQPGAPSSSLFINTAGDLGVGTSGPTAPIHVVRNGTSANAAFLLQNTGGTSPQQWFFQNQAANGAFVVTPNASGTNAPLKVFPGAPENSITIGQNGGGNSPRVGIHRVTSVQHPLQVGTDATNGNGAHVTAAGIWTDGSSRTHKDGIVELAAGDALDAVMSLQPVRYRGKEDTSGEEYLGFIAEDVPDLVAMNARDSLSPMDIVAALTRVVQLQQQDNTALAARLAALEAELDALRGQLAPGTSPTP
jgi:hypothetical protein